MGTLSIKPVGTPVATPLPPLSARGGWNRFNRAARAQSVAPANPGARMRNDPQNAGGNTSNNVVLDRAAGSVVYQVVDNRTSLVVKQFPEQDVLRRRAYARALDQAREDVHALGIDRKI